MKIDPRILNEVVEEEIDKKVLKERSLWKATVEELCKEAVANEEIVGENFSVIAYMKELLTRMEAQQ